MHDLKPLKALKIKSESDEEGEDEEEEDEENDNVEELRGLNWKTIIFVPFSIYWMLLILFSVIMSAIDVVFEISFYDAIKGVTDEYLFMISESFYYVDTALQLLHNILRDQRLRNVYLPKKKKYLGEFQGEPVSTCKCDVGCQINSKSS